MSIIRLIVFDIDGVLTDGNVYVDQNGNEIKRYRLTEIDALNSIVDMGVLVAAITGEDTPIVKLFENKIDWAFFSKGCKNKSEELKRIADQLQCDIRNVCYIGDGKYDREAIINAGLGVCPANAIQEVKEIADVVLSGRGGESCVYELYQMIKEKNGE